jgi:aminoglycoside phosphotransferase (APT) family kinase protein
MLTCEAGRYGCFTFCRVCRPSFLKSPHFPFISLANHNPIKSTSNLHQPDKTLKSHNNQSTMDDQAVLGWQYNLFGNLDIVWLKEPDTNAIEKIVRRELDIPDTMSCTITFLAEGSFNKVYDVQYGSSKHYIMRIAAPVQPQLKTSSEVATIEYVRHSTDIPVPTILEFNSSHDNELGFEWMLMGYVPGSKLDEQWRSMAWPKKELLMRKVVALLVQLFQQRFPTIGNLYMDNHQQFRQGQNVERVFFWENHLKFKVPRGPFSSSQEWLRASLDLKLQAADHPVEVMPGPYEDSDEEERDESRRRSTWIKNQGRRLIKLLPKILRANEPQTFTLHHHDLHANNISVNANHELSGIINWECMPTVPLWAACEIPKFLQTLRDRDVSPDPNWYSKKILGDGSKDACNDGSINVPDDGFEDGSEDGSDHVPEDGSDHGPEDGSDDGSDDGSGGGSGDGSGNGPGNGCDNGPGKDCDNGHGNGSDNGSKDASDNEYEDENIDLYYDHLEEYEMPKLRALFLEEMQRACPEWVKVYRYNKMKAGLAEVVTALGDNWRAWLVSKWIDAVEEHGYAPSISDMVRAHQQSFLPGELDDWFDGAMVKAAEEQGVDLVKYE